MKTKKFLSFVCAILFAVSLTTSVNAQLPSTGAGGRAGNVAAGTLPVSVKKIAYAELIKDAKCKAAITAAIKDAKGKLGKPDTLDIANADSVWTVTGIPGAKLPENDIWWCSYQSGEQYFKLYKPGTVVDLKTGKAAAVYGDDKRQIYW